MKKYLIPIATIFSLGFSGLAIANQLPAKPLSKASLFTSNTQCEDFLQQTIQQLPPGDLDTYAWFFHYSQTGTSALTINQNHYIDTDNSGTPNSGACGLFVMQNLPMKFKQEAVNDLNQQIDYYNQNGKISSNYGSNLGLKCPANSASNLNNCQLIQA